MTEPTERILGYTVMFGNGTICGWPNAYLTREQAERAARFGKYRDGALVVPVVPTVEITEYLETTDEG